MNFDWTILHWIQNTLVCPAMDFLMPKITLLGNGGAVWILAAGVLLATKKYRKHGAFLLAGLAVGVLAGNLTLKPLIAFSRLYLYVHFPTDILGAAVLGMAIGLLTCIIGDKIWTALAKKGVFLRAR